VAQILEMVEMEEMVLWNYTTDIYTESDFKLWAIVKNGIVVDGWWAKTEKEAIIDNPGHKVVLVKPGKSFMLGAPYYV